METYVGLCANVATRIAFAPTGWLPRSVVPIPPTPASESAFATAVATSSSHEATHAPMASRAHACSESPVLPGRNSGSSGVGYQRLGTDCPPPCTARRRALWWFPSAHVYRHRLTFNVGIVSPCSSSGPVSPVAEVLGFLQVHKHRGPRFVCYHLPTDRHPPQCIEL